MTPRARRGLHPHGGEAEAGIPLHLLLFHR